MSFKGMGSLRNSKNTGRWLLVEVSPVCLPGQISSVPPKLILAKIFWDLEVLADYFLNKSELEH